MMKIAICDDETVFAERIKTIVLEYYEELQLDVEISLFHSGMEFANLESDMTEYQIVFLDINMEKMDGIQTARRLREISDKTVIIFVTAYMEYILTGYKVEALRYILKNDLNFKEAVKEGIGAALKKLKYMADMITIPFQTGDKNIFRDKIVYLESMGHYIDFYLWEDSVKKYTIRGRMDEIYQYLDLEKMVRIHQSYMVNLDYCAEVKYNKIILRDLKELPVSKAYSKEMRKRFYAYKGEI